MCEILFSLLEVHVRNPYVTIGMVNGKCKTLKEDETSNDFSG